MLPQLPNRRRSVRKTLTAIAVLLASRGGRFDLDRPVRDLLGDDLPLVNDRVTARQLLHHRSGIGDYFDEVAERSTAPATAWACGSTIEVREGHDARGRSAPAPGDSSYADRSRAVQRERMRGTWRY